MEINTDCQLLFELSIGGISTLIAVGVEAWLRRNPRSYWLLIAPIVWLLCLGISSAIATRTIGEHPIIVTMTYVAIALGGCRLSFLLAPTRISALTAVGIICGVALLTLFELREPFINYLDSFTITIGETRLSLMKLIEAVLLMIALFWVSRTLHHWFAQQIRQMNQLSRSIQEWLIKFTELILYFVVISSGLYIIGVDISTLAVFGGAFGVALGFGFQKIISNYVSGLILLFEKTVKIGDLIELEGGPSGHVYRLDPRGTFILCPDGKEVIIPNEEFITKKVTNYTYSDKKGLISIPVGVSYDSDVEKVREILLEAAVEHPLCLTERPTNCYITEFGPHAIHMVLQFWIGDISPGSAAPQSDVMFKILSKFKKEGIKIPVVHFAPPIE